MTDLWQQGLFSFDASVLLNIYGYSKKTRDELVDFIEKKATRVRLPYQFGLEYARNRSSVIVKQVHNYLKVEDALRKIKESDITPKRDHPFLSKKSYRAYQAIISELEDSRRAMEKLVGNDPYAEKMFGVFEDRVGKRPTNEELLELEAQAKARYDQKIPPGFADLKEKDPPEAYGDCIAWHQLMEIAKAEQKDFILVTDDFKEDWWLIERGRTIGPRPELLEEFARVTQQKLYVYNSENFLLAAKEFTSADIRDDVIEEVSQRLASQRATEHPDVLKPIPAKQAPLVLAEKILPSSEKLSDSMSRVIEDQDAETNKILPDNKLNGEKSDGG